MAQVYSVQFGKGVCPAGSTITVFTVPAGHVYVIRTVTLARWFSAADGSCYVVSPGASGGPIFGIGDPGPQITVTENGRWVFEPGDQLTVHTSGADYRYFISGYDLLALGS